MSFIYWKEDDNLCFENYTLILPAIAVGNVGQLSIDLLLNNLKAKCVAYLHHSCFLPVVGADAFDPDSKRISTSCEMYECKEKKLVIIQHRAPIVKNKEDKYLNFLLNFIKEHKIKTTLMLSSSFAQFFTYDQLQSVPLHYLCTQKFPKDKEFQELNWKKFSLPLPHTSALPGGGISKSFFDMCEQQNIPAALLIMVCSEGNNYAEAYQMVSNLNAWLKIREEADISKTRWLAPFSWNFPYANDAPNEIFW